ncbi:hypothetical protein CDAR_420921 [Caerostris darwini]|uniref:Uncharacterized protein n=1 Tax=Caerostris darwini TaxID=1538125 RepID=A0AAV4X0K3_9ARAC|nr:hypothetical protein CDAR_420921 [Caerostris darwini]
MPQMLTEVATNEKSNEHYRKKYVFSDSLQKTSIHLYVEHPIFPFTDPPQRPVVPWHHLDQSADKKQQTLISLFFFANLISDV